MGEATPDGPDGPNGRMRPNMVRMPLLGLTTGAVALVVISAASAQPLPGRTFTTIDVPGATNTVPVAINDAGQIVGYFITTNRRNQAFMWAPPRGP